ncbi:CocE/NonD family hydrolase [Microbacterium sp. PMB16]|uniref:CocE/NonD family hydrolase n=1 Tax=Microbacterium sp. PMB16 TaxID=3120157 RepID=UPI003F4CA036
MPGHVEVIKPASRNEFAIEVMVPMSDGVRLATDVYLTGDAPPRPVLLIRLPYDKSGRYAFMPQLAQRAAERGYVLVAQDVRGKFRSEGDTLPCRPVEVTDAYDTIEWASTQPWCDGSVVMTGDSYYGYTQWAAVAGQHPALRAIAPGATMTQMRLTRAPRTGSVFMLGQAEYVSSVWLDNDMYGFDVDWSRRPLAEALDPVFEAIGRRSPAFDAILANWDQRDDFVDWPTHPFSVNSVPVLHRVGWFDNLAAGQMRDYVTLLSDPVQAPLQYLLADATDHENYSLADAPIDESLNHDDDDEALARILPRYLDPALDFFDAVLNDTAMPARVRFLTGHGQWRAEESWPPPGTKSETLFLAAPVAVTPGASGQLVWQMPQDAEAVEWRHDPDDLVPSSGSDPFAFVRELPEEGYLLDRSDVLSFRTEPLEDPVDIVGEARLSAFAGTDGPSMHLFVKLVDEAPDGSSHMILRGQVDIVDPDPTTAVEISLGQTAYRMRRGHRLRVHIASSDFPRYMPHPGTDEHPMYATRTACNEQTLHIGGATPSALHLSLSPIH